MIPPAAPVITDPVAGLRNTTITDVSGTAEANSTVEVFDNGNTLGTTDADNTGAWSLTGLSLGDGSYVFTAIATDEAGNPSDESAAVNVIVNTDTTAPAAPVITDPTDGATLTAPITSISGTAEANSTVEVFDNGNTLGTTDADNTGAWSLTGLSLGDGSYVFTAIATDEAGNPSDESAAVNVIVQTGPTTIDTSMSLQLSANKATPSAGFTASGKLIDAVADAPIAGQEISVTINGLLPVTATTDNKGQFSVQLTAPNTIGVHEVQAHFAGVDDQYNPSDSSIRNLKVEGAAPVDTSLTLKLSKNKVNADSSYSATGTLLNEITKKPITGMTISVTTDGSSAVTGTTDSKGKYDIQLTAPNTNGDHDIQAHFTGNSQFKSSDSPVSKLTVQGGTNLALTTTSPTDTSLSLKVEGKDKMAGGVQYSVSGKLLDSVSKKPISGKEVSVTTDGDSPKDTDTTNSKGEFDVDLKAPDSPGKYDIKAHFDGDSQYKPSDSSESTITVEAVTLQNQKNTVTTNQPNTDEQQTDEQQTDEEQTDEQSEEQTDEQSEEQTDEQSEEQTDEQSEEQTDEQSEDPEEEPEE